MGRITSYHPLHKYPRGPWASDVGRPPPFADSSCRREPDLENPFPAITGLCRLNKTKMFAVGERVAYFTVGSPHRLAAILLVVERFSTHASAASGWYRRRGIALPRNLIVPGNGPLRFGLTCGFYTNAEGDRVYPDAAVNRTERDVVRQWDEIYMGRQIEAPHVLVCQRLFVDLENPPELSATLVKRVFPKGKFPGTQTPAKVDEKVIDALVAELGVRLEPVWVPPPR